MKAIEELSPQVGTAAACRSLGVPRATLYRRRRSKPPEPAMPRPKPPRALLRAGAATGSRRAHSEPFADKAPAEVYAALLDQGQYLCSIRTMYRVLDSRKEVRERRDQLRHPTYHKPQLVATAPNQVWSWDITKLLGPAKWTYFHLYVILDIFSRYVVGWMLASRESEHLAERLIRETVIKQGVARDRLTIHSDRGPSMRSQTVAQLLATLGDHQVPQPAARLRRQPVLGEPVQDDEVSAGVPRPFRQHRTRLGVLRQVLPLAEPRASPLGPGPADPGDGPLRPGRQRCWLPGKRCSPRPTPPIPNDSFGNRRDRSALPSEVWINPPADGPEPRMLQLPRDTNFVPQLSQTR